MVSDKLFQNAELGDNLVENKMRGRLTVGFNYGHSLYPFCEVIDSHNNMMMPPIQSWFAIHKIKTPLGEGIDSDNRM